jgi:hypothetical protein
MSGEHFAHVRLSLVTRRVMHLPHPTFESAAYPSMRVDAFLSEGTRTNAPIFKPSRRASPRPELTDARPPARGRHRFFATFALPDYRGCSKRYRSPFVWGLIVQATRRCLNPIAPARRAGLVMAFPRP